MTPSYLGTLSVLLNASNGIQLTRSMLEAALYNHELTSDIIIAILDYKGPFSIDPQLLPFMFSRPNYISTRSIILRWRRLKLEEGFNSVDEDWPGAGEPRNKEIEPRKRAILSNLNEEEDIQIMLIRKMDPTPKISWNQFGHEGKLIKFLCWLRQFNATIDESTVWKLLRSWDADAVRKVLEVQSIKITERVIQATATNFEHGEEFLKVLLDMEAEDMDADVDGSKMAAPKIT